MEKIIQCSFLFLLITSLSAHEQSLPLNKGNLGFSYFLYPRFSYKETAIINVDAETGEPVKVMHSYYNRGFSALSGTGDFISIEYGILNVASAGIRFNTAGFIANGISSNSWDFQSSFYARYNIWTSDDFKCHAVSELWCNPLFTNMPVDSPKSKNFIFFNTISANWKTGENIGKKMQMHFFTDLNIISTILNPEYNNRELWLAGWNFSEEQKRNVEVKSSGGNRLALSTGFDFTWKKLTASIELNFPIVCVTVTEVDIEVLYPASDIADFLLNNIQLKWMYRF